MRVSVSSDAALGLEPADQRVELGGVGARDAQVVVRAAGDVRGVGDLVELADERLEAVGVRGAAQSHVHERDEAATGGRRIERAPCSR